MYKRFDDGAINDLHIDSAKVLPSIEVLKTWKNLGSIEFQDTTLGNSGYTKQLGQLKKLQFLTFTNTPYSAKELVESGVLSGLRSIRFIESPYKPVLPALPACKNLLKLSIRGASPDAKDWKIITSLKIDDLDLSRDNLSKQNFVDLAKLKNLDTLSLAHAKFNGKDLLLLANCKKLAKLKIDSRIDYEEAYEKLAKRMPKLELIR